MDSKVSSREWLKDFGCRLQSGDSPLLTGQARRKLIIARERLKESSGEGSNGRTDLDNPLAEQVGYESYKRTHAERRT